MTDRIEQLEQQYLKLTTAGRAIIVAVLALVTIANLILLGVTIRTMSTIDQQIARSDQQTRRILFLIDCHRQRDLEQLLDALDAQVVNLQDEGCPDPDTSAQ